MDIETRLEKLGLSKNEIHVYLALLKMGQTSAYQLAKRTGLSQPSVYYLLDTLREKGLLLKTPKVGKHTVVPRDPREFLEEKKREITDVEQLMPRLLAEAQLDSKPNILFFEGNEAFGESIEYLFTKIRTKKMVSFLRHSVSGISKESARKNNLLYSTLGDRGIHIRAILPDQQEVVAFMQPYIDIYGWDFVVVSQDIYAPHTAMHAIDNMLLINAARSNQTIIVENQDIADAERMKFELVWGSLKDKR